MKVLITGSSGLLGRILSNHLLSRGIRVVGLDIRENNQPVSDGLFHFHKCCITDKAALSRIFQEEKPTHVVHFACTFNKVRDRDKEHAIDIGGSRNVLEVANETPCVRQLVYSSSAAAYGANRTGKWYKETDPLNPGAYRYGVNKKLIEETLFSGLVREDLHVVVLRIAQVVGPSFDKPGSAVSIMIRSPWLPAFGRKNSVQFLHSDDFSALVEKVIRDKEIRGIYNLAPDSASQVEELARNKKYLPVPFRLVTGLAWILWTLKIANLQPASVNISAFPLLLDPARIMERYGYTFRYSTKEAFEDTVVRNQIPKGSLF